MGQVGPMSLSSLLFGLAGGSIHFVPRVERGPGIGPFERMWPFEKAGIWMCLGPLSGTVSAL